MYNQLPEMDLRSNPRVDGIENSKDGDNGGDVKED